MTTETFDGQRGVVVMLRGRWLARADIDAMLNELTAPLEHGRGAAQN